VIGQQPNESKKDRFDLRRRWRNKCELVTSQTLSEPIHDFQRDVGGKFRIPVKPQIKTVGTGGWISPQALRTRGPHCINNSE